jgi:uncharacterized protein YjbI with pentapeptide repeats
MQCRMLEVNFRECPKGEVRRILIPRTPVNKILPSFIVDSSVVDYDGGRNVRDEERSVGRKKQVRKAEPPSKRGTAWPRWTGFRGKTAWDFLQLLIVPLMLVAIGFWFTAQQDARQQKIEKKRAEAERELAVQRAQDEALQAYLSQMSQLMLEKDLRHADAEDEVLTVARARTLTVLERLDPSRKTAVMQFITEAGLVQGSLNEKATGRKDLFEGVPVISLSGADLSGTDLSELGIGAPGVGKLSFIETSPRGKYYFGGGGSTFLDGADLSSADLSGADLHGADMPDANLEEADLSNANLSNANLSNANLYSADLSEADLSGANLSGARGLTNEELDQQAKSLEDATMPNGQKYEEWLKDREGRKEGSDNE